MDTPIQPVICAARHTSTGSWLLYEWLWSEERGGNIDVFIKSTSLLLTLSCCIRNCSPLNYSYTISDGDALRLATKLSYITCQNAKDNKLSSLYQCQLCCFCSFQGKPVSLLVVDKTNVMPWRGNQCNILKTITKNVSWETSKGRAKTQTTVRQHKAGLWIVVTKLASEFLSQSRFNIMSS